MPRGRLLLIIGIVCSLAKSCQARDGTACSVPNITRVNFQYYIEVLNGTNRTLSCEIHSDTALKEEPIWRKDDLRLPTGIKYIVENASCSNSTSQTCLVSNLTLIKAVRFEYKGLDKDPHYVGNYSLTAENDCGTAVVYVFVDIIIPPTCEDDYNKPPQLKIPPPSVVEAVEGHSVTIRAQYEGNKNDRNLGVYWCVYKTPDDYYCYTLNEDDNYNVLTDGCPPDDKNCCYFIVLLKIKSVTRNLTLQSMVIWQQDPQSYIPGNSSLVANVYPTLDKRISKSNNKCVELTEGQSTEFTCIYNASTNPNVTITTWEFNEELLEHDSSHYTMTTQYGNDLVNFNRVLSRITLSNVKPENAGTYTCQCAYNPKVIIDDKDVVSEAGSFCLKVKPAFPRLIIVVVVIVISILVVLLILFCYWKRQKKKKSDVNETTPLLLKDTIRKLLCQYFTELAPHWYDLGVELLEDTNSLIVIRENYSNDIERCCNEMFDKWLDEDPEASLNKLISALKKLNLSPLAKKIRKCEPKGLRTQHPAAVGPPDNQMMNVVADNHSINDQNGLRERNPSRSCRGVAISTDQADNQEKSTKSNDATAAVTAVGTATATATSATGTATVTITADDNGTITATATAEPEGTCNQLSISRGNGHSTTKRSKSKVNSKQSSTKPLLHRFPSHEIECQRDGGRRDANRKLLYRYVTELAPHWYDLGVELLEKTSSLRVIKEDYPNDVKKCCNEMFDKWLDEDAEASWNKLIDALKKIKLFALAEKIRSDVEKVDDASSTDRVENQDMLFSGQDPHPNHQKSHHQSGDVVTEDNVAVEVHDQLPTRCSSLESFKSPSVNGHVDQPLTCSQDVQDRSNKAADTKKPTISVFSTEEPIECEPEGPQISHPAAVRPLWSELVVPRPLNQAKINVLSVDTEASTGCHNKILNSIAPECNHINMVSLLPYLLQHYLVTSDEEHHLSIDRHSSVEKAQLLLKYLKRKGNESLQKFLCCLNLADEHSGHKGIADKLKQMMEAKNIMCADFCAEHQLV